MVDMNELDKKIEKEDMGHYYFIYSKDGTKILEVQNNFKWNSDADHKLAVDKKRYENGDYVPTDEPITPFPKEPELPEPESLGLEDSEEPDAEK